MTTQPWRTSRTGWRMNEQLRTAIVFGQELSRCSGGLTVGPQHLLVALLRTQTASNHALAALGVTSEQATATLQAVAPQTRPPVPGAARPPLPLEPESKRAIESALALGTGLGHPQAGTVHLLHALFDPPTPALTRLVQPWGFSALAIREAALSRRWPQG